MSNDYIPTKDSIFDGWYQSLINYVDTKTSGSNPAWPTVPVEAAETIIDAFQPWHTAYVKTQSPHTAVDTEAKNDARAAAERLIRAFVNQYLRFPPVTNEDRTAMEIPNHDTTPTPIPVPTTRPEFGLKVKDLRRLDVDFHDQDSASKAKPYGYDGAVIFWSVLDTPPLRQEDLTRSELATRTPHTLSFEETERGKRVYIALRWQNEKGEKGPWSELQDAIVP
jgi:hypothetical protein